MKHFELLDISGDAGIRAFGKDLPELFVHAGIGMYSLITDVGGIAAHRRIQVTARGDSLEGLMVAWLNELIFQFDTYGFIAHSIEIDALDGGQVAATLSGEEFDQARHRGKLLIKAATYHKLKVERQDGHWVAEIVFDI